MLQETLERLICTARNPDLGRCDGTTFFVRYNRSRQMFTCTKCGEVFDNITPPSYKEGE